MFRVFYLFLILVGLVSCGAKITEENNQFSEKKIWINSAKVDCIGVSPMSCFQVQYGDSLTSEWENFYNEIEGFEYQAGYRYCVLVQVEKLDEHLVPADGSTLKYKLKEVISKEVDVLLSIHDIWLLQELNGNAIPMETKSVTIEIFVSEKRIAGNGGCNNYFGSIPKLTENELLFDKIGATSMACDNMEIEAEFLKSLGEVAYYKKENLELVLQNQAHEVIMRLKKVD